MSEESDTAGFVVFGTILTLGGLGTLALGVETAGWVTQAQLDYYTGFGGAVFGGLVALGGLWLLATAALGEVGGGE